MKRLFFAVFSICCFVFLSSRCKKSEGGNPPGNPPSTNNGGDVQSWVTTGDQARLLDKQNTALTFGTSANSFPTIEVDTSQVLQTIDGFGYTLTSGSAAVMNLLPATDKAQLLDEIFGHGDSSISVSFLRISIGASDLSDRVYSYDDMPAGQTDVNLEHFSINPDQAHVIPLLKEILVINPNIKILATPWSAPVWMKDTNSTVGGNLKPEYYDAYARYFVRYIQAMESEGITVYAITPQNEPLHPGNNPSMHMTAAEQATFIKNHLGPAFAGANIDTRIIIYDHNCDRPDYPLEVLNDACARPFIHGSAFHLYAGDISALTTVHNSFPDKHVYFTEQYTASDGHFDGDLRWHVKNVIIGSMRNWSRTAFEWNLANDPKFEPHTPGGCTTCKGALTIGNGIVRNVAYFIIAHASKFVPAGSVRIASNITGSFHNVAFKTPAGKKVLIVLNDGSTQASFNVRSGGKWVASSLPAGAVATLVW